MNNSLKRKIWLVGASTGIGRELAIELAKDGDTSLALSARNQSELKKLNEELGNIHTVLPVDVSDEEQVKNATKKLYEDWGRIDSVIFMAGIYKPMSLGKLDLKTSRNILDVNLLGAFYLVESVLPFLKKQDKAQLALCGSVAGYRGLPDGQPYCASKAGIISLAESLRLELDKKIDIKLINPGFVKTRLTDKNDFKMAAIITPDKAAKIIAKGLKSRKFEIHFPKRFTLLLKIFSLLPAKLYFLLMRKK